MGNIEYRIYTKWVTFFEANSELVTSQGYLLGRILMAAFLNAYIGVNLRLYRYFSFFSQKHC